MRVRDETIAQLKHKIDMKLLVEHDYAKETEANQAEQIERKLKVCQAEKDELLKKFKIFTRVQIERVFGGTNITLLCVC